MFPRDRVIAAAKYNIPFTEEEATESLTTKLAQILCRPDIDQNADHAGRPGGGIFRWSASAWQNHGAGHHGGRRIDEAFLR